MYKHILLPTDGSTLSTKALRQGLALAKQVGARATAVIVRRPLREFVAEGVTIAVPESAQQDYIREMDKLLDTARREALDAGVTCDALQVLGEDPWEKIIETANERKCDLIVMASHGYRGLTALLLGSETQKVLAHATVPVLVVR